METLLTVLAVLVVAVIGAVLVGQVVKVVTVHDYERGIRFRNGRLAGLLGPGTHVFIRPLSEVRVLDGRPTFVTVEGQEVLTADGVAVKVSLAARYVVGDPTAAITLDADFVRTLYLTLQLALREVIVGRTLDDALSTRREIGAAIQGACASDLAAIGIELLAVEVRDLMVPGDLKRAFAGVVAARKEGEAALERARGETAALRNLANAAQMIEDRPGLVQLRILQELGASSGNTIVLGMPDGTSGTAAMDAAGRRGRARTGTGGSDGGTPDRRGGSGVDEPA